jgi:hypothetical protein
MNKLNLNLRAADNVALFYVRNDGLFLFLCLNE